MLTKTAFLLIIISSLSMKCVTSSRNTGGGYSLREMLQDVLAEKRSGVSDEDEEFFDKRDTSSCKDTPDWHNGYKNANDGKGWTCEEYTKAGSDRAGAPWCKDGNVVPGAEWTMGAKFNFPENNCCACGGGICQDTPDWHNGYKNANGGKGWTCSEYTTTGKDKSGAPWCKHGKVSPGAQWAMGAKFNFPENNCCACGRGQ